MFARVRKKLIRDLRKTARCDLGQTSASVLEIVYKHYELFRRLVERVHLKLRFRWTAQKHPFQELLRNRISEAKYRAPEKAVL